MNFITTTEAASKWCLSSRRVLDLAKGGRIPGVKQIGTRWMIPEHAEKPADGRTRAVKNETQKEPDPFRFPGFEYRSLSSFDPPLNGEELTIKAATEAFHACRYKDALQLLGDLADRATDRYIRICALYTGCMLDIYLCNTARFLEQYGRLTAELDSDFPHKEEMVEYIHEIESTLGFDSYYADAFRLRSDYDYHESFLPRLANLSAVSLTLTGEKPTKSELRAHELNCILLKDSEAYADLVPLHLYLGIAYAGMGNREKQKYHLREALTLSEKYGEYYSVAMYYYYSRRLFKPVIREFPEEFRNKIERLSESDHKRFVRFTDAMSMNNIYKLLPHNDYIFLNYAVQGISNKEIADRLNISVGTVGKRYGDIYALLGVKNKAELSKLYKTIVSGAISSQQSVAEDRFAFRVQCGSIFQQQSTEDQRQNPTENFRDNHWG